MGCIFDMEPSYLPVAKVTQPRKLRSQDDGLKIEFGLSKTFQDQAQIFNELPKDLRENKDQKEFIKECKSFFKTRAHTRAMQK